MKTGTGTLSELYLDGNAAGLIHCSAGLIPAAGQYLSAHNPSDSFAPLPVTVFSAGTAEGGFFAAPPLPSTWTPGTHINLRGPLGKGFSLPSFARAVALAAFGETPSRLLALLAPALKQGAAVTLLSQTPPPDMPAEVELMPLSALSEVCLWADYIALDIPRGRIPELTEPIGIACKVATARALITTPMPCAALGDCGACAVTMSKSWKMACKDGPVFDLKTLA